MRVGNVPEVPVTADRPHRLDRGPRMDEPSRMAKTSSPMQFKAKLSRPAAPKGATWTFLVLPKAASAKLPTRAMVSVEGTLGGAPFEATLEPDGQGSHWLKVCRRSSPTPLAWMPATRSRSR